VRDGDLNVHTIHTEIEGGEYLGHLEDLLRRLRDRLLVATLGEVAASLPPIAELPLCAVVPGRLPGRGGTVAMQVRP
ncbi:MAG: 4-deoxy-4-formamido-L-arabinose-phosphoundecaprenol deformylase, partial [Alphaproteobacteria bacterium]